ncbi:MAG: hypothetical protein OXH15_00545 [Gammaproteobacteria bacterium]|nr:hypothetical protein [Gammaproteobacteria bacterium]
MRRILKAIALAAVLALVALPGAPAASLLDPSVGEAYADSTVIDHGQTTLPDGSIIVWERTTIRDSFGNIVSVTYRILHIIPNPYAQPWD